MLFCYEVAMKIDCLQDNSVSVSLVETTLSAIVLSCTINNAKSVGRQAVCTAVNFSQTFIIKASLIDQVPFHLSLFSFSILSWGRVDCVRGYNVCPFFAQTGSKLSLLSSLRTTWKQSKLRGIFAGNGANCVRVFPFAGLVCLTYANIAHVSVWNYSYCNENV